MTNLPTPAKSDPVATAEPRKLDDVLLAMDVVDTLRHRTRIATQELNAEAREAELVARLKDIYTAQGIEVPERILKDGVKALDERRFVYEPPKDSFQVQMARLYVNRRHWLPQSVTGLGIVAAAIVGWQVFWAMPKAAEWKTMPAEIAQLSQDAQALAVDPVVDARIVAIARAGEAAVADGDRSEAREQVAALEAISDQLRQEYDIRVVQREGENSGFYRYSETQPGGQDFYAIVEAVAPGGRVIDVPVRSEETGETRNVSKWAQHVNEDFYRRLADSRASGLAIQNDVLGSKARGELEPVYSVASPGGAITEW